VLITERHIQYKDIRIYCDEPADKALFFELATASKHLSQIPKSNVNVYPSYSKLGSMGSAGEQLRSLVREDRPDYIFTYRDLPFLVVELTEHGYTGDNPLQRFTRFAASAEQKIPFVYFTPFSRTRDDELDRLDSAADFSTLSKRNVNTNVFLGMLRLSEIFQVPMIALDWPVADNGRPIKLGNSPNMARLRNIFGELIDVIALFVSDFAERVSRKEDVTQDHRIQQLQERVRALCEISNIRGSAIKLLLPKSELIDLVCEPKRLIERIGQNYFFADKPERLLGLRCLQEARVEYVELPSGQYAAAKNPRKQLACVFDSALFPSEGYAFYTGYKWRSDPHCGVAVNIHYTSCRPPNSLKISDRSKALVLFYPRIALQTSSNSHTQVVRDLTDILSPKSKLYSLFDERYVNDDPSARRHKFHGIKDPLGIWKETTKQARIFRRYCDLIVLSDAILLGDIWK
jgi:hypothetical protein